MDDDQTVFTIGHGPRSFGDVAPFLEAHQVALIADVRSAPYSRHAPDFTKDRLVHLAAEANIGYRWLGDRLGGRPGDCTALDGCQPDWDAVGRSDAFAAGSAELMGLVTTTRVVLLCAEMSPDHCHRALLIAPALERHGFTVVHILGDGSLRRHQPQLHLDL